MGLATETRAVPSIGFGKRLAASTLAHNVVSLYAGQALMYLAPLITVPYLTRVLGPEEWGRYSFALAVSVQLALLVDYGFGITASRAIATLRDSPVSVGLTLGAAMAAKAVLIVVAGGLAAIAYARIPSVHPRAELFWFAVAAGITQGLNFSWFLYGVEKIAMAVALDLGNRLLVAGAMVALVHAPGDAWIFFALQTVANVLVMAAALAYILRRNRVKQPSLNAVRRMLGDGIHAMLSRCGFGIFTGVNTFLLGLHAASDVVGQYAGAERIARVVSVFPTPISQALFPRISHLKVTASERVSGLRRFGGAATLIAGALTSIVTFALAPMVTRLLLGPGFDASSTVLRVLSPLPLLVAANQVLVYQFLFPEGEYRFVSLTVVAATAFMLAVLLVFGRAGNPNAMALAADIAEAIAFGCLLFKVRRQSGWPFATTPA